jgi:hypothetical protein
VVKKPPFDIIKAAFMLFAGIVTVGMLVSVLAALGCSYSIIIRQTMTIEECRTLDIRGFIMDLAFPIIAIITAASRGPPPPPPPPALPVAKPDQES